MQVWRDRAPNTQGPFGAIALCSMHFWNRPTTQEKRLWLRRGVLTAHLERMRLKPLLQANVGKVCSSEVQLEAARTQIDIGTTNVASESWQRLSHVLRDSNYAMGCMRSC
jgi:hypothetical protein